MGRVLMPLIGGGADTSIVSATANDVVKGKVIVGPNGEPITGTLELSGNAGVGDVLAGKTFYSNGFTKQTGTMESMAGGSYTPTNSIQTIQCSGKKMTSNIVINASPVRYVDLNSSPITRYFRNTNSTNAKIDLPITITNTNVVAVKIKFDFGQDDVAVITTATYLFSISGLPTTGVVEYKVNMSYFLQNGSDYINDKLKVSTSTYANGTPTISFVIPFWSQPVKESEIKASLLEYYVI